MGPSRRKRSRHACSRRSLAAVAALLLAPLAFADTARELAALVETALAAKTPDADVAAQIHKAKLTERLDDAVVDALETAGAGPLALAALDRQRELTEALPAASWRPEAAAAPSSDERARIVAHATSIALEYSAGLPNFVCTETVRRFSAKKATDDWKAGDVLLVDVASNGKQERYKLLSVNGKPTTKSLRTVGGFTATGEFDSLQRFIFDPKSQAAFTWERVVRVRGRDAHVFAFRISQENSEYRLNFHFVVKQYQATTAARGLVYLDAETHKVLRLRLEAEGIPSNWPILRTPSVLDYDFADVGGHEYLLPKRFDARVVMKNGSQRNVTEFANYRRFSAEATVSFEK